MDTNQDMIVKIGGGNIKIGHLTQMGKLNDIFEIGNKYRLRENKKKKIIEQFLSLPDTWEFILGTFKKQSYPYWAEVLVLVGLFQEAHSYST